ncbi:MAG TPA: putative protein N(5)-glutamine methyltransferase [Candidatus Binatia bacterium]|nr:putative protein N(5)-glutamine methyltransferase [Candidatus Binatia bacterium]
MQERSRPPRTPPGLTLPAIAARLRAAGCVFAEDEARLLRSAAASPAQLGGMVERRAAGDPLEYVIGWGEFCGLRIAVGPGVFVPRHRTELLVREAVALLRPGAVVVDLCCGAGAVGAALVARIPGIELHAADIDPRAVGFARRNLDGSAASVHQGDLYAALPAGLRGRVDVIVCNPPYVPTAEIETLPREARLFEAAAALDGGSDGLALVRRVAAEAPSWLARGGHLLVECSERQAPVAVEVFAGCGLTPRPASDADLEATAVLGSMPA